MKNETFMGAAIGAWIGSISSFYVQMNINHTETLLNVIIGSAFIVFIISFIVFAIVKLLKI